VISRSRLAMLMIGMGVTLATLGCSDAFNAGPLEYVESEALTKDIPGKANLAGKLTLQAKVRQGLINLYGENPQRIKVPEGAPLLAGGIYLGNYVLVGAGEESRVKRIYRPLPDGSPDYSHPQEGGYAIYRRNCLHCHGVSGAGDGPTAPFLYPAPRDYRKGIFKFTSTNPSGARPHRDDLRQTVKNGLHGTSMPAFDALLSAGEIEEVIDYVVFLSARGETELGLIEEASISDEKDPNALSDDIVKEVANAVFNKWKQAQNSVLNPPIPRTVSSRESILRGRELFLGRTTEKLECAGCHGKLGLGDGESFVAQADFNDVVFGGNPSERAARIDKLPEAVKTLWKQKPDEWGNPLRPANLQRGIYKGGRRPLDLYWRIAKGINGAQMPAHYPTINEQKIWDLVNFVLVLPYQTELLTDPSSTAAAPTIASTAGQP
jgi:mono/diheme cytochrome c family protein